MSEALVREEKTVVVYVWAGEVCAGVTPGVPAGITAPAVAVCYRQAGRSLLARYTRTAEGPYRLEYQREM